MNKWNKSWIGAAAACVVALSASAETKPPNVLFFSLDDLCDWISPMGHTQAITPNMERLAKSGVTFMNAHTAGIFCAPSRSAIFSGRHASTTGCYTTQVYYHDHPEIKPLQQTFQEGGYATYGAGKLFHHPAGYIDQRGWDEFFVREERLKKKGWDLESWSTDMDFLPQPYPNSIYNHDRDPANKFFLEWGKVLNENEGKIPDTIRTEWACNLLKQKHDKPCFVAVGLYATHFPNYAPAKYFDLYDRDKIELPPYKADDLDDLPPAIRKAKMGRSAIHKRLESLDAVEDAVMGYLACISYADAMLGRLLDAIEAGPNADNTIVVLWSDQGYHHGEKFDWGKHTLWGRTSKVPFIWAGPGIAQGQKIDATVSLMDMFPTLVDLAGIGKDSGLDGMTLEPILKNPTSAMDRDVYLPGMKPNEYAIINGTWRYIHYADETEELYNVKGDPNEWDNLANNPEYIEIKQTLKGSAPESFAAAGPNRAQLDLVIKGDTYEWKSKNAPQKKIKSLSGPGVKMTPRKSTAEAQMSPVKEQGRSAWTSEVRSGKPTYFYFKLNDPAFQNGKQPAVQLAVTYLDRGNTAVVVQYDSSDAHVNESNPNGAGAFKEASRFQVKQSGEWMTTLFNLDDAKFAGRCNGGDLRISFASPDAEPVIAEVVVKPLR